jgi:hypothetical protein
MTSTLARRIRKLESILQARTLPPAVFRYGYVQRLPNVTSGERHVAVSKSDSSEESVGQNWLRQLGK